MASDIYFYVSKGRDSDNKPEPWKWTKEIHPFIYTCDMSKCKTSPIYQLYCLNMIWNVSIK